MFRKYLPHIAIGIVCFAVGGLLGSREFLLYEFKVNKKFRELSRTTKTYIEARKDSWEATSQANKYAARALECISDDECHNYNTEMMNKEVGKMEVYKETILGSEDDILYLLDDIEGNLK
jgi:hypothetical protein